MNCKECGKAYKYECICDDCLKETSVSAVASNDGLATLARKHDKLMAIIDLMDKNAPRADRTCLEPGITYSEAARRHLIEDKHPLFTEGG